MKSFAVQLVAVVVVTAAIDSRDKWSYYCSKTETLSEFRRIPPLHLSDEADSPRLLQVQVVIRHGARTPTDLHKRCWDGYDPVWNCKISERLGLANGPTQVTALFPKHYDACPHMNTFKGSCERGQLLEEGLHQHMINGQMLADAYFSLPPGMHISEFIDSIDAHHANGSSSSLPIYFRSSDMQRTRMSGVALLTSLFNASLSRSVPYIPPTIHTLDKEREFLFPNHVICPQLSELKETALKSKEFKHLHDRHRDVLNELKPILGIHPVDATPGWPEQFQDCMLTSACTSDHEADLPSGLSPSSPLFQKAFEVVDSESVFVFTWKNGIYSKLAIQAMMLEVKALILKALVSIRPDVFKNSGGSFNTGISTGNYPIPDADIALLDAYKMAAPKQTCDSDIRENCSDGQDVRFPKLVVWSGHDNTVMPFLAALGGGVYDGRWPSYASMITLETYEFGESGDFRFRIVYNGEDRTPYFPGCSSDGPCSIMRLFVETPWARPGQSCASTGEDKVVSFLEVGSGRGPVNLFAIVSPSASSWLLALSFALGVGAALTFNWIVSSRLPSNS